MMSFLLLDCKKTLTGSTNIDITNDVISAVNLATTSQLGTKQNQINNTVSISCDTLTTAGNVSIGGVITAPNQILFKASVINTEETHNAREPVPYNGIYQDTGNGYNTTTYIYTVPVAGTYYFYANTFSTSGSENHVADITVKRGTVERAIARIEKGVGDININSYYTGATYPCLVGDEVFVYNVFGTISLRHIPGTGITNAELTNFGGFLIG